MPFKQSNGRDFDEYPISWCVVKVIRLLDNQSSDPRKEGLSVE